MGPDLGTRAIKTEKEKISMGKVLMGGTFCTFAPTPLIGTLATTLNLLSVILQVDTDWSLYARLSPGRA